jgi:hypothetical protein
MTRPSKKTIEPLLDEYARLEARRLSIELKRDQDLAPLKEAYEKKAAPIVEAAKSKLEAITRQMTTLANHVNAQLMAGVDADAGTVAISEVAVEIEVTKSVALAVAKLNGSDGAIRTNHSEKPVVRAIASVDVKPGNREIDPEKLFNHVKASERTGRFWSMFKVLMAEADKVLGKDTADELAKKKKSYGTSISLKP